VGSHRYPVSGVASSKTNVAGARKPDVILVCGDVSNHQWSDIISVIDVEYRYTSELLRRSKEYMVEVFTNQVDRRFFVGALLTGPEMRIGVLTRGSAAFSALTGIYADPAKYMQTLSWFVYAKRQYLGYDLGYEALPTDLQLWLTLNNETQLRTSVASIIYNSISGFGCTTRVMMIKVTKRRPQDVDENLIVQEVWQNAFWPSDGRIHELLEDKRRLEKAPHKNRCALNNISIRLI
jgi:hypothetical protein